MKYQPKKRALILLADGTIFYGKAVGNKEGTAFGEVCFNTGMSSWLPPMLILEITGPTLMR